MSEIYCEIITIGDEILYGHILDTNAKWLSKNLNELGVKTNKISTIGDNYIQIKDILQSSIKENDIIILTGGLGPTNDDITKKCLNDFFKGKLISDKNTLSHIKKIFKKRNLDLTKKNRDQALVPDNCKVLHNKYGTAPGIAFEKDNKLVISLPGVPYEMKSLFEDKCSQIIKQKFSLSIIHHRTIKTVGIGESWLSDLISEWEKNLDHTISLAYLPSIGRVKLRLTGRGNNLKKIKSAIDKEEKKVVPIIRKYIYGFDNEELESCVGNLLIKNKKTLSIAESCSGGYLSHLVTSIPGSSKYFSGSIVAYSNNIKINNLNVNKKNIEKFGAVSKEVVEEMATNVRKKFNSSIGISTSGIAGPSGGTEKKPVGTVWIGYSDKNKTLSKKLLLTNRRDINITLSSIGALNMARLNLEGYS
ncbi:MAG: competence/damage-inducible protein A [Bacteroidota bacterium]|nr:competence/damage-inducible protein A [Bacteroidota bacterium]